MSLSLIHIYTVCTTIHSNSCNSTYRRMMTLAKRKYNMDDSILMQIMVEAVSYTHLPGNVQQSTGDSDGDLNKQVGNMG